MTNCGYDPGVITQYDDPETGDQDIYRRVLVLTTFIDVETAAGAPPAPGV